MLTECNGSNEVLVGCLNPDKRQTCENFKRRKDLTPTKIELCESQRSDCAPGYWRNCRGRCVRACECYDRCETHTSDPCPQPSEERFGFRCNGKSKYANQRKCSERSKWYCRKAITNWSVTFRRRIGPVHAYAPIHA